tara:strand:- start:76 stop:480 length:405 start_codon:yes stop_codon:yes gene_type:complete
MRIPVGALTGLVVISLLAGLWFARGYDVDECKVRVAEENRIHFEALKQQRLAEAKAKREASGEDASAAVEANQTGRQYQSIFAPTNLGQQVDSDLETETGADAAVEANQQGRQYQGIFDPGNLGKQVDSAPEND